MKTDWREQIDLSTPHPLPSATSPLYHNLLSPNQWPNPRYLPKFLPTYESYISRMSTLSTDFTSLIAESLNLPSSAFDRFFDKDQQHKLKIVKYPDTAHFVPPPSTTSYRSSSPESQRRLDRLPAYPLHSCCSHRSRSRSANAWRLQEYHTPRSLAAGRTGPKI